MALLRFLVICISVAVVRAQDWTQFELETLESHNTYRALHGTGPVSLSIELCQYAQEWADYLAENDMFDHRPDDTYGENLFATTGEDPAGSVAVDDWYSEVGGYDFSNPGPWPGTEHFTQVVWKSTLEIGIGKATSASGWTYVVANYNPGGNNGQYEENVLPPTKRIH